jgi:hypothetical protein
MLLFVLHHLGDPLEVEFVKPGSFANSFLPHVFGVPKWFLQIRALPKPTPVHYSGVRERRVRRQARGLSRSRHHMDVHDELVASGDGVFAALSKWVARLIMTRKCHAVEMDRR